MIQVQEAARLVAPWASIYNDHPLVQSVVLFAHLSGVMVGGGAAIAADRAAIRARRDGPERRLRHIEDLRHVHRTVLAALSLMLVSGLLLFAADIKSFVASPIFWVKMSLVALLTVNGWVLTRTGRHLENASSDPASGWRRMMRTSVLSASLWFLIVLAGSILVSVG